MLGNQFSAMASVNSFSTFSDWVTIESIRLVGIKNEPQNHIGFNSDTAIRKADANYREGVEIHIRNANGLRSVIAQVGMHSQFKQGSAVLQEVIQNGQKFLRVLPNR
ncbi:hypothetical protein L4D20_11770 [Vibrio kyushuensis]|uniref:hypothetical protein n=1 Tax=Vibrio kyushuensis TaxID=2910249 RepID=UPI003D0EBB94